MRKSIVIFFAFYFFMGCRDSPKKQVLDCSPYKTGKFEYHGLADEIIEIRRDDSLQIETDRRSGMSLKFRVEWVEPCIYDLHFLAFVTNGRDSSVDTEDIPAFEPVRSRIVKVSKNYYVTESLQKGDNMDYRDTILVIK